MSLAKFEIQITGASGTPLQLSFEASADRLAELPKLDLELDGYFVWMIDGLLQRQITGMLYDNGQQLQFVHLHANCFREDLKQLISCISLVDESLQITELPGGRLQTLQDFETKCWPVDH